MKIRLKKAEAEIINLRWSAIIDQIEESRPLVSVVIPVHNVELYLGEALDSVINQTYSKLKKIIDDGSTDNFDCLCDKMLKTIIE